MATTRNDNIAPVLCIWQSHWASGFHVSGDNKKLAFTRKRINIVTHAAGAMLGIAAALSGGIWYFHPEWVNQWTLIGIGFSSMCAGAGLAWRGLSDPTMISCSLSDSRLTVVTPEVRYS